MLSKLFLLSVAASAVSAAPLLRFPAVVPSGANSPAVSPLMPSPLLPAAMSAPKLNAFPVGDGDGVDTNVCNLLYYYCPRDPGCVTYTMSVHSVEVRDVSITGNINAEALNIGDILEVSVQGVTTLSEVPSHGSYKIYGISGKNVAAGALAPYMVIENFNFNITVTFPVTDDVIDAATKQVLFGLDVFQQAGGSDEAFCLNIADTEYYDYVSHKLSPPFEMDCVDNGDGTFTKDVHKIVGTPVPAPSCSGPSCDLKFYYCPRDPGCATYTMDANSVTVVIDGQGVVPGATASVMVNGTTYIRSVPPNGSIRIYSLSGKNAYAAPLDQVMHIYGCQSEGCQFTVHVPSFPLTSEFFVPNYGWFEFGLDVFQEPSGSDEAFCIEVANLAYVTYQETHVQPPPGFDILCKRVDNWGHWEASDPQPETIFDATCILEH